MTKLTDWVKWMFWLCCRWQRPAQGRWDVTPTTTWTPSAPSSYRVPRTNSICKVSTPHIASDWWEEQLSRWTQRDVFHSYLFLQPAVISGCNQLSSYLILALVSPTSFFDALFRSVLTCRKQSILQNNRFYDKLRLLSPSGLKYAQSICTPLFTADWSIFDSGGEKRCKKSKAEICLLPENRESLCCFLKSVSKKTARLEFTFRFSFSFLFFLFSSLLLICHVRALWTASPKTSDQP